CRSTGGRNGAARRRLTARALSLARACATVAAMRPWLLIALLAGCSSPPENFTRLWIEGHTGLPLVGTSTEDGVLMLAEPEWKIGDRFEIQFPIGNSLVADKGRIDRLNDTVAVIKPLTSRLLEGRFAAFVPEP